MNTAINTIGFVIRKTNIIKNKKCNLNKRSLDKQMITLHKKLQKEDSQLITKYAIHKDDSINKYHIHLMINYTDFNKILNQLSKYIGGDNLWMYKGNDNNGLPIKICRGKYGEIDMHRIDYEKGNEGYMQDKSMLITLA